MYKGLNPCFLPIDDTFPAGEMYNVLYMEYTVNSRITATLHGNKPKLIKRTINAMNEWMNECRNATYKTSAPQLHSSLTLRKPGLIRGGEYTRPAMWNAFLLAGDHLSNTCVISMKSVGGGRLRRLERWCLTFPNQEVGISQNQWHNVQ